MFYDRANQTADIATFAAAREEQHLFEPGDVEAAYSDTEKVLDLLVRTIIHRNRAAADAVGAVVTDLDETIFRSAVTEAFEDLYGPVQARLDRAWRDRSYSDPNAEHRQSYATEWAA